MQLPFTVTMRIQRPVPTCKPNRPLGGQRIAVLRFGASCRLMQLMLSSALSVMFVLMVASTTRAWDFRDEVYACTTQKMTLAELSSAGVTLVSHCPYTREWVEEAARYGIRGLPYISLYKVYDTSAPGADPRHPFWGAVNMSRHPEWVYVGPEGQRERPFGNRFYSPLFWQSCTNNPDIADAYARGAANVMEAGAGGVFIDNVLPASTCYGPQFGLHKHLHPRLSNIDTFKLALRKVGDRVHGYGPDKVVMLNVGNPFETWAPFGNCIMLEGFLYNVSVRPGPGTWVGKKREQVKNWPQVLQWISRTAPYVDQGGSIVVLEYLPDIPKSAFFSFAVAKLANFLWTGESDVRRDICRTLYRCRLQRASGPLRESGGVYWRHYPNGMVTLNPTANPATVRIAAPPSLSALADVATDEIHKVNEGHLLLKIGAGAAGVYITPQALAEGHLREAQVAAETALGQAARDKVRLRPGPLVAAIEAIQGARTALARASDPTSARRPVADALRAVARCLPGENKPGLSALLIAGEKLSRDQVLAELTLPESTLPSAAVAGNSPTIRAGGIDWRVGGKVGLVAAGDVGVKLGLTVRGLSETHGWLNPSRVTRAEVVADEPKRKVVRATLNFEGERTKQIIDGIVLGLEMETRAGDPMLTVTAAVRNRSGTVLPAYFNISSTGTGVSFSSPGKPAQAGKDYVQVPYNEWTFVSPKTKGGSGLLFITDQPQSYSRYALHLYSKPRSGDLAPGESRAISFRLAPVKGPWQIDPQVSGPLTRAQIYLTKAWTLTASGHGLPALSVEGGQLSGIPLSVQLLGTKTVLHVTEFILKGVTLLDANGTELIPTEIIDIENRYRFSVQPGLREDIFYQIVGHIRYTSEDLPLAVASDFRTEAIK